MLACGLVYMFCAANEQQCICSRCTNGFSGIFCTLPRIKTKSITWPELSYSNDFEKRAHQWQATGQAQTHNYFVQEKMSELKLLQSGIQLRLLNVS